MIYEFLSLKEQNRYQAVLDYGTYIETKIEDGIIYHLYAVDDFYVILHYNKEQNRLIGNFPFNQGLPLAKYLPK